MVVGVWTIECYVYASVLLSRRGFFHEFRAG